MSTPADSASAPAAQRWPLMLSHLLAKKDLDSHDVAWAMDQTMTGMVPDAILAAFLVALRAKGESVAEMRALSEAMLAHAEPFPATYSGHGALDIVGTGGDGAHTVNISTMASLVAAGAGQRIIKHGNRAASSLAGAADVLEALGVRLDFSPEQAAQVGHSCGITFCFARTFHPSMRYASGVRSTLKIPTAFNFLGPLTNPAQPTYSAVGVGSPTMAPIIAGVFAERGRQAVVVRGDDGLDEVTPETTTSCWWVTGDAVTELTLDPRRVGFTFSPVTAVRGADATANAQSLRTTLAGAAGPVRDVVLLNAGLALALTADPPDQIDEDVAHQRWADGIDAARASIDDGLAHVVLDNWVAASQRWPAHPTS